MIPKIIHYCWLSGDPYPAKIKKCIKSWSKKLPDWEIKLWDCNCFDVNSIPWCKEAFEKKKYAFVADYIRFYALYNYGGVYLDSDVEVVKSLNPLLDCKSFMGDDVSGGLEAAVFGSIPHQPWVKQCLDHYTGRHFIKDDGTFDVVPVPALVDKVFSMRFPEYKLPIPRNMDLGDIRLYTYKYFSPKHYATGKYKKYRETFTIHHFDGSWLSPEQKKKDKENLKRQKKNERRCKRIHDREVFRQKIMVFLTSILKKFVSKDQYARLRDAKDRMVGKK